MNERLVGNVSGGIHGEKGKQEEREKGTVSGITHKPVGEVRYIHGMYFPSQFSSPTVLERGGEWSKARERPAV